MSPKIAMITPYAELGKLAEEVSKELAEPLIIRQGALEEAISIAQEMENDGVDVIISRGGTAANIRKHANIPVVLCEATALDVLLALREVKKLNRKAALISFSPVNVLDEIAEILGMEVAQFCAYEDSHGAGLEIDRAVEKGFKVILGSLVAVRIARERGLEAVPLYTSKETVREAVLKAREIAIVRHKEMERNMRTQAILDFAYEGIVVMDENGMIQVFNPAAERITGISAQKAIGQKIDQVVPNTRLPDVKNSLQPEIGELQEIGKTTIITSRIPIIVKEKLMGVVATFQEASSIQNLEHKIRKSIYKKGLVAKHTFNDILGDSPAITRVKLQASRYSNYESTILLSGETGSGKELFANAIHNDSPRRQEPFVALNCAAFPETLLESEMFGYDEGAFTGAKKGGKPGLFEIAHNGTIFLDEISGVSLNMQVRLLRVIQEKEVMRLGSDRLVPVDVRIIAATNENLAALVAAGRFREDLYFRLNVLRVCIPPLRERKEDIPMLAQYFLKKQQATDYQIRPIDSAILKKITEYQWPGNVRELRSFITRYAILANELPAELIFDELIKETAYLKRVLDAGNAEEQNSKTIDSNEIIVKAGSLKEMEMELIKKMLIAYKHNQSSLAKTLGISRSTLWKKLQLPNN